MSVALVLKCEHCGHEGFLQPGNVGPNARTVCPRCHSRSTFGDLTAAAESVATQNVDGDLARVRDVNRRFPDR